MTVSDEEPSGFNKEIDERIHVFHDAQMQTWKLQEFRENQYQFLLTKAMESAITKSEDELIIAMN